MTLLAVLTLQKKKCLVISYVLASFFCPGDHNHSVGAAHLDVCGGNSVFLPLLCCLYLVPLPLSMQEEADPGKEGELFTYGPAGLHSLSLAACVFVVRKSVNSYVLTPCFCHV